MYISGILISGISNYIPNAFGGIGRDGPVRSGKPSSKTLGIIPCTFLRISFITLDLNCWHCKTELIWGADADIEEDFQPVMYQEYSMVTNLSCPKCDSYVEVYLAK